MPFFFRKGEEEKMMKKVWFLIESFLNETFDIID